jgi:hypothetical protein
VRLPVACRVGTVVAAWLVVGALSSACAWLSQPTQAERLKAAADLAVYRQALLDCKEEGKDAGSLAVYTQCADEVDRRYGFGGK